MGFYGEVRIAMSFFYFGDFAAFKRFAESCISGNECSYIGVMKKILSLVSVSLLVLVGFSPAAANEGFTYQNIGTPTQSSSGMTVTVKSVDVVEGGGSTKVAISYNERNSTSDKDPVQASFKLFFTDGTVLNQYGFFNKIFPGDQQSRSYNFQFLSGKTPWMIEYDADFFAKVPTSAGLKWKVGSAYPTSSPAPVDTPELPAPVDTPEVPNWEDKYDEFAFQNIGTPTNSSSGMTLTVKSIEINSGLPTTVTIRYNEKNNSSDQNLAQRPFKLFFTDGTELNQSGVFRTIAPGGQQDTTYSFQFLRGMTPWLIEYEAGLSAIYPTTSGLKWKAGYGYPAYSPYSKLEASREYSLNVEAVMYSAPGETIRFDITLLGADGEPLENKHISLYQIGSGSVVTPEHRTGADGKTYAEFRLSDDAQGFFRFTAQHGYANGSALVTIVAEGSGSSESLVASQRTLATFSESSPFLSNLHRGQVKAAVKANPNAEKFICTGIRYYSQPMSVNIMVRKRAKAACEYAKELNPSLSTWYQNKPTQARSYAGKVLLTIKSPE